MRVSPGRRRHGAVLICVMVVLLIVGLMTSQVMQTFVAVRQSERQREQLRQAHELVEYAKLCYASDGKARSWTYQLPDESKARIQISRLDQSESRTQETIEISVDYPYEDPGAVSIQRAVTIKAVTMNWEGQP